MFFQRICGVVFYRFFDFLFGVDVIRIFGIGANIFQIVDSGTFIVHIRVSIRRRCDLMVEVVGL
jgi:hypothetical protein